MSQNAQKQVDYLLKLTDNIGIIEHCRLNKPDYIEGYCVDDNARALQVCLRLKQSYPVLNKVLPIYFDFLKSALKKDGLYNDLNSDHTWQKNFEINSEHYGRSLAALGETIEFEPNLSSQTTKFFDQIYSSFTQKSSPHLRVSAQIILGLKYYRSEEIKPWADLLVNQYLKEKTRSWHWFEPLLSYDNGRLPLALLTAYQITSKPPYLQIALESLDFLTKTTFDKKLDCFVFPGNQGWIDKKGYKTIFDQQPIEAGSITESYCLAYKITKKIKYKNLALKSFAWYSGKNILNVSLINPLTGSIYDGLTKNGVNLNQGAESVLSYLLAYSTLLQ